MSYQSDNLNLAKQFILSKVNVSSSGEKVSEEKSELVLNKKKIMNNSSFSTEQKNQEIGKLLFTQAEYSNSTIMWNNLRINGSVPKNIVQAKDQLSLKITPLMPKGYSFESVNNPAIKFKIITISAESSSDEEKRSKIHQLFNLTDPLTVQTTVHEAVTSPSPDPAAHHDHLLDNSSIHQLFNLTDPLTVQTTVHEAVTSPSPDPAAHHDHLLDNSSIHQLFNLTDPLTVQTTVHEAVTSPSPDPAANQDNLLDNSSSLIREFREVTSFTTSGGHRTIGLLNRVFAPLMRFYTKIQAADRLATGEASQSCPEEPGLSGGQLMKAAFILNNQHTVLQASVQWREISSIPMETAAFSSFNQSLSNPVPQVGITFWQC